MSYVADFVANSLLLPGDIETNPGPDTVISEDNSPLSYILSSLNSLSAGQAAILNLIKLLQEKQKETDKVLGGLRTQTNATDRDVSA